jgi:HAE1 family hydrophobic/amphiphilic exporter-1
VVVEQLGQHLRRVRLGRGHRARCASRRARSSTGSASSFPADVENIQVNSFRSSDIPVLECRIAAERDLSRDYELLNRHVADPLRRGARGRPRSSSTASSARRYRSSCAWRRSSATGSTRRRCWARLDATNRSMSAGQLRRGREDWPLRVVNQFSSIEDIQSFPVNDRGLTLAEVADVHYREPDLDYGRHLDRSRAIGLNVIKESGANTVKVVDRAREVMKAMEHDPMLQGIQVLTFTDQADQIKNSLRGLLEAGMIGAVLSVGVLFFFLRRLSATLVVAIAIPVSLLAACALMYFNGRTLNILSMMGLMLAVGMLVDNAVVVQESIYRHRQRRRGRLRSALEGAREVMPAVISATATSVIVFLPLVLGGRTEITT